MNIIDLHCDALMKLQNQNGSICFADDASLDTNKARLLEGQVALQCFAIFIDPEVAPERKLAAALGQVDLFYNEVLGKNPEIRHIRSWDEIDRIRQGEIGAFLSLEGVEPIGNDLGLLRIFYQLGVLSVGLTWNYANLAADGVLEQRGAGLTKFGRDIVSLNNENMIFTDVSHLSERAFWDVLEIADFPIASHSNSQVLCGHPRNLTDSQAAALFEKGGQLHVVFYPDFISENGKAEIQDLIRHIDHFCGLGGSSQIGFGSDFDGIGTHVKGLEHAGFYQSLINELLKHYPEELVKGFAHGNFLRNRPQKNKMGRAL